MNKIMAVADVAENNGHTTESKHFLAREDSENSFTISSVCGNCNLVKKFLARKSWKSSWAILKFVDAALRGIGQIGFANNPFVGLLVTICFFIVELNIGIATVMGAFISNIVALLLRQPASSISNGLQGFNGTLVAIATLSIFPEYGYKAWILAAVGSVICVPIQIAVGNIFETTKLDLPIATIPYNIIMAMTAAVLSGSGISHSAMNMTSGHSVNNHTETDFFDEVFDAAEYLRVHEIYDGILQGMGQMFAVQSTLASYVATVGIFFYSPLICLSAVYGSTISTLLALLLVDETEANNVFNGLWGYNGALIACAICLFYVPTLSSFFLMTSSVLATCTFKYFILALVYNQAKLPIFSIPFVTLAPIFLAIGSNKGFQSLRRTNGSRTPEAELKLQRKETALRKSNSLEMECISA